MLKHSLMPIIFSALAMTRITSAENAAVDSSDAQQQPTPITKECISYAKTMRVAARHIEAGGIGYNKGYSTIEAFFAPSPFSWDCMPFLDLRGHAFNDGRLAANAGLGVRLMRACRIYGINAYYDYRKTKRQHYNQFSLGLETLGNVWDFRINGYLPFGDKKSSPYRLRFDHFSGNNIILSEKFEFAMKGADAEVGFHFGRTANWDCWAAAGPYYFIGDLGGPTWGAKGRIGASFRDFVTVQFLNSWDRTFRYRPQGQIAIAWPFGPKAKMKKTKSCPCSLSMRMVQPVDRQEIIVVGNRSQDKVAINPATGLPFFVLFVDNTSSSNGTFESPYSSLTQAEAVSAPGDIIYVFPGNGTTTNMDMGIALQSNQRFWGSGISHNLITTLGPIVVPVRSATNPLITNTAGSAITLASGNDVSGFSITRPNLHGINGSNVTDISLSNLWIFGAQTGNGVNIIENNGAINNLALFNLFVTNNAVNGIFIQTDGTSTTNLLIDSSTATLNGSMGMSNNGIVLSCTLASNINATLQNNAILTNLNQGLVLDSASTGILNYHLENNTINDHSDVGMSGLFSGNSNVNIALLGNVITGNFLYGSQFSFTGPAILTASHNHIDQNSADGCRLTAGNAAFTATFENNSMNQNNRRGLGYLTNGSQNVTFVLRNNDASYNCDNSIVFASTAGMQLSVEMLGNTVNGNCGTGVTIGSSAASISVVANDNVINGNCGNGLVIAGALGTLTALNVTANNNSINGNCSAGISIAPSATIMTTLNVTLNNNNINGNCGDALNIAPDSVDSYILTANYNTINGNSGLPVFLNTQHANSIVTINNSIIKYNQNRFLVTSSPSGTNSLAISLENNQIIATTNVDGIQFQYIGTNTGTNSFTAVKNNITYSRNGIIVDIVDGANGESIDIDISDNSTNFNGDDGIDIIASPANAFTLNTTLSNNTASNNEFNGIHITAQNSVIFNIHAEQNTLFNNNPFGVSDLLVTNNSAMASICLEMRNNSSNVGYSLTNVAAGPFNLAPNGVAGAQAVNTGTITPSGVITSVPSCP